jgi:hypothetical protein
VPAGKEPCGDTLASNLKFTIKALQPSKMNKQTFAVCSFFTVIIIKEAGIFCFCTVREDTAFCSGAGAKPRTDIFACTDAIFMEKRAT